MAVQSGSLSGCSHDGKCCVAFVKRRELRIQRQESTLEAPLSETRDLEYCTYYE